MSGLAALCLSAAPTVAQSDSIPAPAAAPVSALADLEARMPKQWNQSAIEAFAVEVIALAGSNTLSTGDEFHRLALISVWGSHEYRGARVRYELVLAAIALGHTDAEKELQRAWDNLLRSLGRPMRSDSNRMAQLNPGLFDVEAAPKCIADVWLDPAAARAAAAGVPDNAEVKAIVDADVAARNDRSFRTPDGKKADHERNARMREIIAAGELRTAADFANASLVMQHGGRFSSYQFAHELGVTAMLLGDKGRGRFIAAAGYDRMLRSVGHDQRFGTQQTLEGPPVRVDEEGISDAQRVALGRPTLAEARARRNPPPRQP